MYIAGQYSTDLHMITLSSCVFKSKYMIWLLNQMLHRKPEATFLYGCINEVFNTKATSLMGSLILGQIGGSVNKVLIFMM